MWSKGAIELDDASTWSVPTEDLLAHLHQSGILIGENKSEEARQVLDSAFKLQSGDPMGQATLGLVYFKLGIYPRALSIYKHLVDQHPKEPTLRLNLAIIYFKTGQSENAKNTLEELIRFNPDYRKAHAYLGLAHWRMEQYHQAQVSFERAGVDHLAQRMAKFLESEHNDFAHGSEVAVDTKNVDSKEPPSGIFTPPSGDSQTEAGIASFMKEADFQAATPSPLVSGRSLSGEPVPVAELMSRTRLPAPLTGRFLVSDSGYLLSDVAQKGFTRLDGLRFLSSEGLSYKPARRRFRGTESKESFGTKDTPMFEIEGNGRLGFKPGNGVFSAVSLDDDIAYIKEDFIFAFDPELDYENGRIPKGDGALVHFRGRGAVVLCTPSKPESLDITPNRGVVVPQDNLVGWFGRIVPRAAGKSPFDADLNALELTGEGALLICLTK